jgi:FAD/FMN-containing dehydrogenase
MIAFTYRLFLSRSLFFDNVVSCDIVTADSELITCTATNDYKDLFFGLPWSYGALGLLVSAELKIIPLKPFVELTYIPFNNAKEMYKEFTRLSMQAENGPMFVEALAFSKNQSVLMVGEMTQVTDMRNGTAYNRYPPSSFDNVVLHFFFVLLCPTPTAL